jgi:ATP-dependent RNA helicase DeaD
MRRIFQEAGIKAETRQMPQAEDVKVRLRQRFFEGLARRAEGTQSPDWTTFASELLGNVEPTALVAALLEDLHLATGRLAGGYQVQVLAPQTRDMPARPKRELPKRVMRERKENGFEPGMARLRLNMGRMDRIVPGHLVRLICTESGLASSAIGAIAIHPSYTFIDVQERVAKKVVAAIDGMEGTKGRRWAVALA